MKKFLSLVIALSLLAALLTGFSVFAAVDSTNVIKLSEVKDQNMVLSSGYAKGKASDDGGYVTFTGDGTSTDTHMLINGLNVTNEYDILVVKYAASETNKPGGNQFYVDLDGAAGLKSPYDGKYTSASYESDNTWKTITYKVSEAFTGVAGHTISCIRICGMIGEMKIAYIGFFKTTADAEAYDKEYTTKYNLDNFAEKERVEVVPEALDKVPSVFNDFSDSTQLLEDSWDKYSNGKIEIKNNCLIIPNAISSLVYKQRWKGASEISFDLVTPYDNIVNMDGFFVRIGKEIGTPYYENDRIESDESQKATTGTSGIGFSFRGGNGIQIFVKSLDEDGKATLIGHVFTDVVPELTTKVHTYKVVDNGTDTVTYYVDGIMFAKVKFSDPKLPISKQFNEKYYSKVSILDKDDNVLASTENGLVSTQSTLAFGVRGGALTIDNLRIGEITELPSEETPKPSDGTQKPSSETPKPSGETTKPPTPVTGDNTFAIVFMVLVVASSITLIAVISKKVKKIKIS